MTTIYVDTGAVGESVLDVGCGQAFMAPLFSRHGFYWTGVTIGDDYKSARAFLSGQNMSLDLVHEADMTFLPFEDNEFDLIFARHVLEHSPFPIITLMEWHRVAKETGWLCLVAPAPHFWLSGGRNHYSIVPLKNLEWWLRRSGWEPVHYLNFDNRMESFLKHLTVIPPQVRKMSRDKIIDQASEIVERYPEGPVEYRIICRYTEEAIE
jgi:SAM-dependent methyltransferase